jgi:hypothetical protein
LVCSSVDFGSDIVAWTTCPGASTPLDCVSQISGFTDFNVSFQLHVSSGFVNAGYDLDNSSIEFVTYTAPPSPYNYTSGDIFDVLHAGFGFYNQSNNSNLLISANILGGFAYQIQENSLIGVVSGDELNVARNILTIPLIIVNEVEFQDPNFVVPGDYAVNGYLAKSHYRVLISNYSLYTFSILAIIAMCWSGCVLVYCWRFGGVQANMSHFAEIDFAAKCSPGSSAHNDLGMGDMLHGLGNTESGEVKKRTKGKTVFLGAMKSYALFPSIEGTVVLSTKGEVGELRQKEKYL